MSWESPYLHLSTRQELIRWLLSAPLDTLVHARELGRRLREFEKAEEVRRVGVEDASADDGGKPANQGAGG